MNPFRGVRTRSTVGIVAGVALVGALGCSDTGDDVTEINHMPVILSVSASPAQVFAGRNATLLARATDEDGDALSYSWVASVGVLLNTTGEAVIWQAPSIAGFYDVLVSVSDRQTTATATTRVQVLAAQWTGQINVESSPSGATVILDGLNTGLLTPTDDPTALDSLTVGEHRFSVSLPDRQIFPDSKLDTLSANETKSISFTFVSTNNVGRIPTGATASPPQLTPDGFFVTWSDDRLGTFEVRRNGVNGTETDFASPEPVGYDGDVYFPNWGPGGIVRLMFQDSVADTGARLFDFPFLGGEVRPFEFGGDARRARVAISNSKIVFVRHEREGAIFRTRIMEVTELSPPSAPVFTGTVSSLIAFESTEGRIEISTPVYSSAENALVYSRRMPDGTEDIYVFEIPFADEHRVTTSGDAVWPTFGTADRMIFYYQRESGEVNESAGVFGADLDQTAWSLGRAMRIGPAGARFPAFGRPASGDEKFLAYVSGDGVIISRDFED